MKASSRIVVAGYGALGDMIPLFALARGLQQRGHHVIIASAEMYRSDAERLGFEFYPAILFSGQSAEYVETALGRCSANAAVPSPKPDVQGKSENPIGDALFPHFAASFRELLAASAGADLLISNVLAFAAPLVAECTGIRWVSLVLQPLGFFSAFDRVITFSATPTGVEELSAAASRAAWFAGWSMTHEWSDPVRRLRAQLGLSPGRNAVFADHLAADLVLGLFSRVIAQGQPDWPVATQITGFLFDAPSSAGLPRGLQRFLAEGTPPVVVTLGSHSVFDLGNFYSETLFAVVQLGLRVVLIGPGTEARLRTLCGLFPLLRTRAIACEYAPFHDVFPYACTVVHHGGIGTMARALSAGKPMLLAPQGLEQLDNAHRAERLGCARVVASQLYHSGRAALELVSLLSEIRYRAAAMRIARVIQHENGMETALNAIDTQLQAPFDSPVPASSGVR